MKQENKSKIMIVLAMSIWGTIGIFRRYIPMPSGMIAFTRGLIGTIFLLLVILIGRKKISFKAIKENLILLILSGTLMAVNWILLFEAYKYTTVATATVCYYMEPVFVMMVSPIFLKEKLSVKKVICILVSLGGMAFVSGIFKTSGFNAGDFKGVLLGLGAAALYASVVILNKKIKDIGPYDKTIMQLGTSIFVILPYMLLAEDMNIVFEPVGVAMMLLVGILHTGVAYTLYFGSMDNVKAQTIALFSYIDPVVAIILSALILHEQIGVMEIIGAAMVLGATLISELPLFEKKIVCEK